MTFWSSLTENSSQDLLEQYLILRLDVVMQISGCWRQKTCSPRTNVCRLVSSIQDTELLLKEPNDRTLDAGENAIINSIIASNFLVIRDNQHQKINIQ